MNMWDRVFEICRQEIERCMSGEGLTSGVAGTSLEEPSRRSGKVFIVAIDGMCGSGKSTVAGKLQEYFGCSLFHMDDFFLQPHQRTSQRLDAPGGNVDYERFQAEVLIPLKRGRSLFLPPVLLQDVFPRRCCRDYPKGIEHRGRTLLHAPVFRRDL